MQVPSLFHSHRLADLVLAIVLLLGAWSYFTMPRAQYPEVNLNWVAVAVVWPGAAAQDVEREIARPLENAARQVQDIHLVAATSRDHVATLLIRFRDIPHSRFEQRLVALDREIRQASAEFPKEARAPQVIELTSSNFFPTAMVAVSGEAADGRICQRAEAIRAQLENLPGVARVQAYGQRGRELEVRFDPEALLRERISAETLTRAVMDQTRTYPAGMADMSGRRYAIRVEGLGPNPDFLAELPIATEDGRRVPLSDIAKVRLGVSPTRELVHLNGKPAVLLSVIKSEGANSLALTDTIRDFVQNRNTQEGNDLLKLVDDQSQATRESILVMEKNALFGMAVVLAVTWFFLGQRMALLTSIGVPFALAGMFLFLNLSGQTLNVSVLLGVAIVLGIPLDDAVVVADAIRVRLAAGLDRMSAVKGALAEVAQPVTASVFATCLAFAPLLFLPGLMGRFMFVTPLTVIATLLMSLLASLWLLPRHALSWGGCGTECAQGQGWRTRMGRSLRRAYGRGLAWAFRHVTVVALMFGTLFLAAGLALGLEWVKPRWFASDPLRIFNLNVYTPPATPLKEALKATEDVEKVARKMARPGEVNATLSMAGLQFTPRELVLGEHLGQVTVSLAPESAGARGVDAFVADLRQALKAAGKSDVTVQVLSADLPMLSSLSLRLTDAPLERLAAAAQDLSAALARTPGFTDTNDDTRFSQPRMTLKLDATAAAPVDLDPFKLAALIRLHFEGIPAGKVVDDEETLDVVVRGQPMGDEALQRWLSQPWKLPDGRSINPGELFTMHMENTPGELRRVNGERTATVIAGFDQDHLTAAQAVERAEAVWNEMAQRHPGVKLAQGGELDDVKASLNDLLALLVLGFVLMYGLLALQFGRLVLPLVILATAPMALAGVVIGLWISGQPVTLYTLYGGVALSGVAVNASIVLASAGEDRLALGMHPLRAAFHAARRRLLPIIITTLTVIGGLVSLAFGWGGDSLLWGPVASAIVWGLAVATPLTLFVTPLMHGWLMGLRLRREGLPQASSSLG
ncbi:MAG: efflux RND transporter permease subunit [Thiobacillus sp.]|nr:efflux RND transporter permease subunit [Thiobacillus sp.]